MQTNCCGDLLANQVEIVSRNKGVPGVNVTLTFPDGKSIYRAVVPKEDGSCWLVVDSYVLDSVAVNVPTMEAGVEYVKGLTK